MIKTKNIETIEDFKSLKKGDSVACEFKRDVYVGNKKARFGFFTINQVKTEQSEIILQKKHNVYFNYSMFLNPKEVSNLKEIMLLENIKL